jgi:orotate phosphoribosyltransferase
VRRTGSYGLPAPHEGHFVLESGLHTDRWYDLETLFCDAETITPALDRLVAELGPHRPTAICGPLVGGAFLAQRIARRRADDRADGAVVLRGLPDACGAARAGASSPHRGRGRHDQRRILDARDDRVDDRRGRRTSRNAASG